MANRITIKDVQKAVCDHFSLPLRVMTEPDSGSARDHAPARHVAMFVAREVCRVPTWGYPVSFPELGRRFNRDHTSVIHGCNAVRARLATDPDTQAAVRAIMGELQEPVS